MVRRRVWSCCSLLLGLLVIVGTGGAAAQGAGATPSAPAAATMVPTSRTTVAARVVDPRHLPAGATANHPRLARPFRRNPAAHSGPPRSQGVLTPASATSAQVATQSVVASFAGLSETQDFSALGLDQLLEPPDVMLAAGPTNLVEMVNSAMAVYAKTGTPLTGFPIDLNRFYNVPAGFFFSDPRVVYDVQSGRWFADGLAFDLFNDSNIYVAVSQTGDPTGLWNVYETKSNLVHTVYDQPFLGSADDKVVVSWNDYPGNNNFVGAETQVLQKSQLLAGAAVNIVSFGPDANHFRIVPAREFSSSTSAFLVSAGTAGGVENVLQLGTITGTPLLNDLVYSEQTLTVAAINAPPLPLEPGGSFIGPGAIDERFLAATWTNGKLWLSGTDSCLPSGDTTARDCLRLIQVSTGSTATKLQDFDAGSNGMYLYYPAVDTDNAGNLHVVFTQSNSTSNPSVAVSGQPAGTTGSLGATIVVKTGATYHGLAAGNGRWGDYLAASMDPANPSQVWVNGEYATSSTAISWGTAIAATTFGRAPTPPKNLTLTAATPSSTLLTWTAATGNTGIELVRLTPAGQMILPSGGPLPANATAFTDTPPSGDQVDCYVVLAVNGSTTQGNTDLLCRIPHVQTATGAPGNFSVGLNGTQVSTLTWTAPGGQTNYVLGSITPNVPGSNWLTMGVSGTATSVLFNQGLPLTCFVLVAQRGTTALGSTDILCSDPGLQSMTAHGPSVSPALPSLPNPGRLRSAAGQAQGRKAR